MGIIKLLNNETIEKIAAGEVIERPSSIVKELVENSLDAKASSITIEINNGGKSYIRVSDDGDGISSSDLDLAFKRHSTSKLFSIDDLYKIKSLGFRGEALASISYVSKVEVITKTLEDIGGIQAFVQEGKIISKNPIGSPKGTTMIVKDLFYNLPVRKKFLKTDLIESNHISDIIHKISLGNPNTSFRFIRDNKLVLQTSKNNLMKNHIYSILGNDFSENMIQFNCKNSETTINGYISNNKLYRSNRTHQYIYVNGRYVNNSIITNSIEKYYKSIIPINRFPAFIIFIEIDPSTIDVNIHPTKEEINFSNQVELIEILSLSVKEALLKSITIPEIRFMPDKVKMNKEEELPFLYNDTISNVEDEIVVKDLRSMNNSNEDIISANKISNNNDDFVDELNFFHEDITSYKEDEIPKFENNLINSKPIGVLFNTYILAEDKVNNKIFFIDQHAAHERVMYEKYLEEFNNEGIATQQLLMPEIVELTNLEMNNFSENKTNFIDLGFDLDEFGINTIAIRGVPLIFGKPNIKSLFFDILDSIHKDISSSYETKLDKIMKIACTKAVKAGDTLSESEIISLFNQLIKTENPHSCPHGRPTILEMTKNDLEKAFLRII